MANDKHPSKAWKIIKRIILYCFIAGYFLAVAVLVGQGLTPGKQSAENSNAVGDFFNDLVGAVDGKRVDVTGIKLEKIHIDQKYVYLEEKQQPISAKAGTQVILYCFAVPENATNSTIKYTSSDTSIATVSESGTVKFVGAGVVEIKAETEENPEFFKTVSFEVASIQIEDFELEIDEIHVGECKKIDVTYTPKNTTEKTFKWVSLNEEIATVDKYGYVTAKAEGTTTIQATSKYNNELVKTVTVTVLEKIEIVYDPVESLEITNPNPKTTEEDNRIAYVGDSITLKAEIKPATAHQGVNWASSDEFRATVTQKGNVKFKKPGTVTITATSSASSTHTDCVTFTILDVIATDIQIDKIGGDLEKNDDGTYSLLEAAGGKFHCIIYDQAATVHSLKYTSSDESVITVGSDGSVQAIAPGTATITVTSTNGVDSYSIEIEVTVRKPYLSERIANFYYVIRKSIGHFGAFFVLGIAAAVCFLLLSPKKLYGKIVSFLTCLAAGFAVAGITEMCQLPVFTQGRYCSFGDVLLDSFGYLCSVGAIYAIVFIYYIIRAVVLAGKKKKQPVPAECPAQCELAEAALSEDKEQE